MKHKTSEIFYAQLDAAVAKACRLEFSIKPHVSVSEDGFVYVTSEPVCFSHGSVFAPSFDWAQGGPIIEAQDISLTAPEDRHAADDEWRAEIQHAALANGVQRSFAKGPTPLVAAMRAFVASKFGDEVDLP